MKPADPADPTVEARARDVARRPAFAARFPRVAPLDALVDAFARGDYAAVRQEAPKLASGTEDPEVRRAALELQRRTRADPLAVWLFVLAAALLVFLSAWWIAHAGPRTPHPTSGPPVPTERVR